MNRIVRLALASTLALCPVAVTQAQEAYPSGTVTFVVPYPPGATTDILSRMISEMLGDKLGGTFITENKPGASTALGATEVAKADPDGSHLLMATATTLAANPSMVKQLSYDPQKDFAPITLAAAFPFVLVVDPKLGFDKLEDLLAEAKANPGKLNFGSAGIGTPHHLYAELLKMEGDIDVEHVPYAGSNAALDAVAKGEVAFAFADPAPTMAMAKDGRVKLLGVTTKDRYPALPDVPAIAEAGVPSYDAEAWMSIVTTAGTPPEVVTKLHDTIEAFLSDEEIKKKLMVMGIQARTSTPEELEAYIDSETEKWSKVIKAAGIQPQ